MRAAVTRVAKVTSGTARADNAVRYGEPDHAGVQRLAKLP